MQPYQQPYQGSNIIKDYALVIIFVCMVAVFFIILNEVVMKLGNVGLGMVSGQAANIINFLILIWRVTPIMMVLGVFVWVFLRAVRREPYQQQIGGY